MPKVLSRLNTKLAVLLTTAVVSTTAVPAFAQPPGQIEGFTEPYADLRLAAPEMGTLAEIAVREGHQVQAGQVLANLDDQVLKAALEVARAGMSGTGALNSASVELQMRKVELEKLSELHERNHASQKEVDQVTAQVAVAAARVQAVREDLEIKRLEYERILAQLRQRQIRSPIRGVVVEIYKDRGEFVSPSDPVVARVVQLDPLLVVFSVPVEHRSQLFTGRSVDLQIGAPPEPATGIVEFVSPAADASSGTIRVKVKLANPNGLWHSGDKSILVLVGVAAGDETSPAAPDVPGIAKRGP